MMLLEARNLHLWRGETHVLRGVSLAVQTGQCLQLTGPNGAGKSSLLRVLCGLLPPAEGQLFWRDLDCTRELGPLQRECAYLGHLSGHKAELSARENLAYLCGLRRRCSSNDLDAALEAVGLAGAAQHRPLRQLSAGQQRRVALARVQLQRSTIWLLDEPIANLDTQGQELFHRLLASHLKDGGCAVVATHQPLSVPESALVRLELQA
jgi:heme exporter protein A